ncbi:PPE family protein [Tsukamurella sp. 8F]|uniref:PPE family protein n=1 Tax=unclassified Tsukamurella TaxID=2633480 RepID=UPI0023B98B7D|nr:MULTISPECIES: PPE family protein [unclassified Tsukamurella]MDF0531144.1 PPE family protein [Tsukamurella sp. 8J]MDF0588390.1 PPE family protein [Tsukamurella sp. 8F]
MFEPWFAYPPERNSAAFWNGTGAGTLLKTAAGLIATGAGYEGLAADMGVNTGAVQAAWQSVAGSATVPPALGRAAWYAVAGGLMQAHGGALTGLGTTWEALRAATPTPAEVAANRTTESNLVAHNFLGFLTPAIMANDAVYTGRMWVPSAANMMTYNTMAAGTLGSIASSPVPPAPPMTNPAEAAAPAEGAAKSTVANHAAPKAASLASGAGNPMSMAGEAAGILPSMASAPMGMLSAPMQVLQAPMQLAQLPMEMSSSLMSGPQSLASQFGHLNGADLGVGPGALSALGSSGAGAGAPAVGASLSGAGAGVGAGGAPALRLPSGASGAAAAQLSSSGAITAPPPTTSKLASARTAEGRPTTGGGTTGAVPMGAGAAGRGRDGSDRSGKTAPVRLSSAAYIPMITGARTVEEPSPTTSFTPTTFPSPVTTGSVARQGEEVLH